MRTVSKGSRTDRTWSGRHSTSTRARSAFRGATSMAAESESTPTVRSAPRSLAAIARTPFPQPRSTTVRPAISPFAVARYATSAAIPAGVGYCSAGATGFGRGSRDCRIRSSWDFFVRSPLGRVLLPLFPRYRSPGGRRPLRRDENGKVRGPGPHHGHEPLPFESCELRFEIVEVHAAENLEELVLCQAQRPPLLQEREDFLPQSVFDGAGLFQLEGTVDNLNRKGVERILNELTRPSRRVDVRRPERLREGPDIVLRNGLSFSQIPLVHDAKHRHVARDLECRRNPVVQGMEAVLARHAADAHQRLGTVVVRLFHEVPKSPLAHDIKNRHAELDFDIRAVRDREFDLAHLGADRVEIRVLVLVQDEPSDQRSLPDSALAHERELRLHPPDGRHGESRAAPHPESKYKQFRRATIGPSRLAPLNNLDRPVIIASRAARYTS